MFKRKVISSILGLCMVLNMSSTALADSGASTLPQPHYIYKTFAPASQTSYKVFTTNTSSVGSVKLEAGKLMTFGNNVVMGSALVGPITLAAPWTIPVTVSAGSFGAAIYFVGYNVSTTLQDYKDDAVIVNKIYFKWTDAAAFEYSVKIESWVELNGTRVSTTTTSYRTGDLL